jgi:ABC-type transporter Mla MlaB component
MWKVRRVQAQDRIVLSLSGRLEGEQLNELEKVFASEPVFQNLTLDLTGIRLVDRDAVRFLANCEAHGASLRNCPAYIREWISAENQSESSFRSDVLAEPPESRESPRPGENNNGRSITTSHRSELN